MTAALKQMTYKVQQMSSHGKPPTLHVVNAISSLGYSGAQCTDLNKLYVTQEL